MGSVYAQQTLEERRKIERWRHVRVSVNEMVRVLRRHRSTIFRELRRNHLQDPCMPKVVGYFAMAARLRTSDRRARQRKLIRHPQLRDQVVERIKDRWTPEQIAGRLRIERAPLRVCQETIIATATPRKACVKSSGGICRPFARPAARDAPANAAPQNSIAMSASCSGPRRWRSVRNSAIGKQI